MKLRIGSFRYLLVIQVKYLLRRDVETHIIVF